MKYIEFLATYCHCYPDVVGNMPCDNGHLCDLCMTPEMVKLWNTVKEITTTVKVWQVCPACPCNSCAEDCEACTCEKYQAWLKVRKAFDHAEDFAAKFLDDKYQEILAE